MAHGKSSVSLSIDRPNFVIISWNPNMGAQIFLPQPTEAEPVLCRYLVNGAKAACSSPQILPVHWTFARPRCSCGDVV